MGLSGAATDGYRVLGQMLGGVLGGVGLGWLFDKVVHTSPLGLVAGLIVGSGLSIWSTVHTGSRLGAAAKKQPSSAAPATDDET
jgi:ATP synthase protein I